MTKEIKEVKESDTRATNTAFILMFPALILAIIAAFYANTIVSLIAVALAIYQFLMLKKFIDDFYRNR
jgi:hypothetical protein